LLLGTSALEAREYGISAEWHLLFDGLSFSDALTASFSTYFMLNLRVIIIIIISLTMFMVLS